MDEYVEVFTASDITFAYLMKANLENAGIPVQINNENLQGAYCLDGMVPSVLVPASYVEQAKQIIKESQQSPQNDPAHEIKSEYETNCPKCGSSMLKGFSRAPHGLFWRAEGDKPIRWRYIGKALSETLHWWTFRENRAWRCKRCNWLVIDHSCSFPSKRTNAVVDED